MKKIIAFDFDGTLIKTSETDKAHQDWFKVMGYLTKSAKVRRLGNKKDYFGDVFFALEKLTGLDHKDPADKRIMVRLARNLFQMLYLARIRKEGKGVLVDGILDVIVDLKPKFDIALVSTAPEDSLDPALKLLGLKDLFDYTIKGPLDQQPSKTDTLTFFVKKFGRPIIYVGNALEDAKACKALDIPFVLAKWDKFDKEAEPLAKYKLSKPQELIGVIKLEA